MTWKYCFVEILAVTKYCLIFGKHLASWTLVFHSEKRDYICFGKLLNNGPIMETLVLLLLEAFNSCVQIFKIWLTRYGIYRLERKGFLCMEYIDLGKANSQKWILILAFTFNTLDSVSVLFHQQFSLSLCSDTEYFASLVTHTGFWTGEEKIVITDGWTSGYAIAFYLSSSCLNE